MRTGVHGGEGGGGAIFRCSVNSSPNDVSPNEVTGILRPLYDMSPARHVPCMICSLDDAIPVWSNPYSEEADVMLG